MHRIRLRAGWLRHAGPLSPEPGAEQGLDQDSEQGPEQTPVDLPDLSPVASSVAAVHYRRPFNCPSGLEAAAGPDVASARHRTPVDLVVESWTGTLVAQLDGQPLAGPLPASAAPLRLPVAGRLRGHHVLTIDLMGTANLPPRLTGIVSLEIHEPPDASRPAPATR